MKKSLNLFPLILFVLLISCENPKRKEQPAIKKRTEQKWAWLKINVDDQIIWINKDQDTCFYRKRERDKQHPGDWTSKEKRFVLSPGLRDSVFKLGEDAIINFTDSKEQVSCYAGQNVTIMLDNATGSISCSYSSISNWTKISKTLSLLSGLTFREVEKQNKR